MIMIVQNRITYQDLKNLELKIKEEKAVVNFTDPKSKTVGLKSESYLNAGYKQSPQLAQNAYRFFVRNKIQKAVNLYLDYYRQNKEQQESTDRDRKLAEIREDRATLIEYDDEGNKIIKDHPGNIAYHRLEMDLLGLKAPEIIEHKHQTQFDPNMIKEAQQISKSLLLLENQGFLPENQNEQNIIDAEFEDKKNPPDQINPGEEKSTKNNQPEENSQ